MHSRARTLLRWLLSAAFLFAGYMHVVKPRIFLPIVPGWVPLPHATVVATGWCELAGAVALAIPRLRHTAGIMLALYSLCVFPANIKHALDYAHHYGLGTGWLYHGPRLLFQPVVIWWCLFAGEVIDWPFTGRGQAGRRRNRPRARPRPRRTR